MNKGPAEEPPIDARTDKATVSTPPLSSADGELLRALADATQDLMWVVDSREFRLIWWNRALGEFLGKRGVTLQVGQTSEGAELAGMDVQRLEALYRNVAEQGFTSVETQLGPAAWLALDLNRLERAGDGCAILVTARDITERKSIELDREDALRRLAEERILLQTREEEQRLLMQNAPAAIFEIDLGSNRITSINDYALEALGYTREEFLALDPFDLIDGVSGERAAEVLFGLAAGGGLSSGSEYSILKKDGDTLTVSLTASAIYQDGVPIRALVVGSDITERKKAQARLEESEARFRRVADFAGAGICIISETGLVDWMNRRGARILGLEPEDLVGRLIHGFIHPEDFERVMRDFGQTVKGEQVKSAVIVRVFKSDDSTIKVEFRGSRIELDGRPVILGSFIDVTEREHAAELLESSERRYRTVVDNLQEGVIVATRDEKLYSNPRMAEMLGFTSEEYSLVPFTARVHPDDLPVVERELTAAFELGQTETRFQFRAITRNGESRWFRCKASVTDWLGRQAVVGFLDDITTEVQAEAAVRQSADVIDTMFRSIQDGFFMTTARDGRLLEFNSAFEEMFCLSKPEGLAKTTTELELWNDSADRVGFLEALRERRVVHDFNRVGRRRNGEVFPASMSAATVDVDGQLCIVGTVRDETDRARAQDALVASEACYRLLADNIADVVWMADPESWLFTYVSPSCRFLDGFEPEDLVGRPLVDLVVPEARAARIEAFRAMLKEFEAGNRPYMDFESDVEIERKDGSTSWAEVRSRFFRDPSTGRPAIMGLARDISRRRAAEDALLEKQEQLDRFFSLEVGLLGITDLEGRFRLLSAGWEKTLGIPAAGLLGRSVFDFFHPDDRVLGQDAMSRLSAQPEPVDFVARVSGADGAYRTIAWRAAPAGDLVYSAARDVTDLVAAEERLRQSQKMEAIGQLAGGIAHDFNNLLTAILGYSELLLASPEGEQEGVREDLLEIKGAAKRAAELTQQILAFSRKQALHPEVICINNVLTETRPLLERLLGETVTLEVRTEKDLGLCEIDPGQFTQVLINLIVNAKDAMPQGGVLILETANVAVASHNPPPELADLEPGRYVVLQCTDTGTGMDHRTVSRIFEPFFTTKGAGQGTGLGLSTVHGIVHQSGGTVQVHSQVGKGTVFTIYLPCITGAQSRRDEQERGAAAPRGYANILVVEDEEAVGALVKRVLTARGYHVTSAKDAVEALAVLSDESIRLDLLVTDMIVPGGMYGGELADAAKSMRSGLEVIYMSGYSRDSNIHGGRLDGSVRFLQKPFTSNVLIGKVEEALAGRKRKGQERP